MLPANAGIGARNRHAASTKHSNPQHLEPSPEPPRPQPDHQRHHHAHTVQAPQQPQFSSRPGLLVQAMHGESHDCLVVGKSSNLELSGNYSITGPAVVTKRGGRLVAEVRGGRRGASSCPAPAAPPDPPALRCRLQILPGGELACWLHDSELCHVEQVLGDEEGRLTCGLCAEHVEVGCVRAGRAAAALAAWPGARSVMLGPAAGGAAKEQPRGGCRARARRRAAAEP
jgi:hypothetical protein